MKTKNLLILLFLILVLAACFRFWQLDSIPPGLYPDEAMNANDALTTLENGDYKVYYPENNGREGLFIWLIAWSFALFGVSVWSLKMVSALIGFLTVIGIYLLTKEIFFYYFVSFKKSAEKRAEFIALIAAFFLAVSFWHTNFSRISFRAILVPFLLCFTFYFLLRGFRKASALNYIWAGVFLGLGFYTYIAFRAVLAILAVFLLAKLVEYWREVKPKKINWNFLWHRAFIKDNWWKVNILVIVTLLVLTPLVLHFYQNPNDFIGRASGISVFAQENPGQEIIKSTVKTLGMFNIYGDPNWRHHYAGSPMLVWPVGIFFLIGIIFAIKHFFKDFRNNYMNRFVVWAFLLSWFFVMLLPAIFTAEGLPHALRTIGAIPVAYILAAFGLCWLIEKTSLLKNKSFKYLPIILLVFAIVYPATSNFNKYFIKWGRSSEAAGAFSRDYVEIGKHLNSLSDKVQKYVIVNEKGSPYYGMSIPAQTPKFIESARYRHPRATYLPWQEIDKIKTPPGQKTVILTLYNHNSLKELQSLFPTGEIIKETPTRLEINQK